LQKRGLTIVPKPRNVIVEGQNITKERDMKINQLYDKWLKQILQLRPDERSPEFATWLG